MGCAPPQSTVEAQFNFAITADESTRSDPDRALHIHGSLHRFRDAVENGWPRPLELDEHSHAGMANRYVAGASNLPFAVLRGYRGSDLPGRTDTVSTVTCPFTGEVLAAVAALNPDVTVITERHGGVQDSADAGGRCGA
jgi:acyl CoA:acetate/3-ketoacid CoA transferase alpha subunit